MSRGDAAACDVDILWRRVAKRRGRDVDIPWTRVDATPRPRRGHSVETGTRLRYACERRSDGYKFACKQLACRLVRDALAVRREVAIMRKLCHPHVLKIVDVYEHRGKAWIVSELCEGGDLLQLLVRERGALAEAAAHRVATQLLSALAACHAEGVVRRPRGIRTRRLFATAFERTPPGCRRCQSHLKRSL